MGHSSMKRFVVTRWLGVVILGAVLLPVSAQELAFPGAEGFGRFAKGGKGGEVYRVTNLRDSGPGSFRDAVSRPGRTVVFDTAGVIRISQRISVAANITIDGQTAPGEGITVYGNGMSFSGADNAIVRYMRVRMGVNGDKGKDAIGKGLYSHSAGGLIKTTGGISLIRNLYIHNHTRNPKVKGKNQFINNVIYNWRVGGYILGGGSEGHSYANVEGNYFIAGPNTSTTPFSRGNKNFHLYARHNFYDSDKNGKLDGMDVAKADYTPVDWLLKPFNYPKLTILDTVKAYAYVLKNAGASKKRDRIDERLIAELTSLGKEGEIISQEKEVPVTSKKERKLHYSPQGKDFVKVSGNRKFNRALYGTNTGFRVEAGDLPEFALYMPGMGGNFQFLLLKGNEKKSLAKAKDIKTVYTPGAMLYEIRDPWLGGGALYLKVLAMADAEGMIVQLRPENVSGDTKLLAVYGGASGKKFSRDGDIGADPESSFYLKPENCMDNEYSFSGNGFSLNYSGGKRWLAGVFPGKAEASDVTVIQEKSGAMDVIKSAPVATTVIKLEGNTPKYFSLFNPEKAARLNYAQLPAVFNAAEKARKTLAERVVVETPDPYINTLGGALSMAADAIWEDPTFLHGAVAWRMRLNAWRGAYVADPLGWHDRAKKHFSSYAQSQVVTPDWGPVVSDTALNLARQLEKIGTSMFSSGYICRNPNGDVRPHHYDMNLVFIDQLLTHFTWTGDTAYVREMWPVIERHLAWEKRNFDADNDGLYDAYCCIWASDALQYSGGGVTHSSAYNYRANKAASELAAVIGKDGSRYKAEAAMIKTAVNKNLWLSDRGWFAEYIDRTGDRQVHPAAGLWTIYHAMESGLPDPFQAYQSLRYIDEQIPHIPVSAEGLKEKNLYVLSTTNWQPYTWSVNNVALAELLHTALAYWQGARKEKAFELWRSALIESMYLSASPGGFQQLSYYDEIRGELYRDFADPIGMAARSLVEGLFGIQPQALKDSLLIEPGFPEEWKHAKLQLPHLGMNYLRVGQKETYTIRQQLNTLLNLELRIPARATEVKSVLVNGKKVDYRSRESATGRPELVIRIPKAASFSIEIIWDNEAFEEIKKFTLNSSDSLIVYLSKLTVLDSKNPQELNWKLGNKIKGKPAQRESENQNTISGNVLNKPGNYTLFLKVKQGAFIWWQPLDIKITAPLELIAEQEQPDSGIRFRIKNNTLKELRLSVYVNAGLEVNPFKEEIRVPVHGSSAIIYADEKYLFPGTNVVSLYDGEKKLPFLGEVTNWKIRKKQEYSKVDISFAYNDKVTNIFRNRYLSPRPATPTLQLPVQGIGNWCYPLINPDINDAGLRAVAGDSGEIKLPQEIEFATPSGVGNNIIYTSRWDNYPDSVRVPLNGRASHVYFLMAGSTNHMQSQLVNGAVTVYYTDGSSAVLELKNPETWWPIEQDYLNNGHAFALNKPAPPRVGLKSGKMLEGYSYESIKGFSTRAIDGGAATVLDLPLDPVKTLEWLMVKTIANEVVIGLMSVTLVR